MQKLPITETRKYQRLVALFPVMLALLVVVMLVLVMLSATPNIQAGIFQDH